MNHILLCPETRERFSDYLDGTLTGGQMQSVAAHLESCEGCRQEFAVWRGVQGALASASTKKAPADLSLRLRVAISHEAARRQSRPWENFSVRWENVLRPALLQVGAGFACAVLLLGGIGALVGFVAAPGAVQANDEPLGAMTSPHFLYSAVPQRPVETGQDAPIVIQAGIDSEGHVYDFSILSGPQDDATLARVRDQLMVQVYEPARVFGEPVKGRVLITFAGVSVHG